MLYEIQEALASWRRRRLFVVVTVATLGVASGVSGALLSLYDAVSLRPLAVHDPQSLVSVSRLNGRGQPRWMPFDVAEALMRDSRIFASWSAYAGGGIFTVQTAEGADAVTPEFVGGSYFDVLGVRPMLGRFISTDDVVLRSPVAVVSADYWKTRFGGSDGILGKTIRVEGVPVVIVGVAPAGFHGLQTTTDAAVTLPLSLLPAIQGRPVQSPVSASHAIGRVKPGSTARLAQATVTTLWSTAVTAATGVSASSAADLRASRPVVEQVSQGLWAERATYAKPLVMLVALSGAVFVLCALTVGGAILARLIQDERVVTLKLALGASEGRLVRGCFIESAALSMLGAIVGLPLAWVASTSIGTLVWADPTPLALWVGPTGRTVAAGFVVAMVVGCITSVIPALALRRRQRSTAVRQMRGLSHQQRLLGRSLVISQLGLSAALVASSLTVIRTFSALWSITPGFDSSHLAIVRLMPVPGAKDSDTSLSIGALVDRTKESSGVREVSMSRFFPWLSDETPLLQPVSDANGPVPETGVLGVMDVIGPKFFDTLRVPLLHGRDFDSRDVDGGQPVAIINRTAAERIFHSTNVVGRSIRVGSAPSRQRLLIVGVSPEFTLGNPRSTPPATVFRSAGQEQGLARFPTLIVSSRAGVVDLRALKNAVLADGRYYVAESRTIDDRLAMAVSTERGLTRVAVGFGGLALLIAIVSLHAITSRVCSMRNQEFGIRLALGEARSAILRGVLLTTLKDVAAGLIAGAGLSLAMFHVLGSATLSLTPLGWRGVATLTLIFGLSAVLAGLLPAVRAASVNPATLLRES